MNAHCKLCLSISLASASAVAQDGWIEEAYPAVSNLRVNPPVIVTADVQRVILTATATPAPTNAAHCVYTQRVNVAALIGPTLTTNTVTNAVTMFLPAGVCATSPCNFCQFAAVQTNHVTNATREAIELQSRDVWQWDAHFAIAERAEVVQVNPPFSTLYRGNYDALVEAKTFISNNLSAFRVPTDTNIPPAPWTLTGLVAAVGAPTNYFEATSQRAGVTDWQYIRPMLTNLYVTWISGGCVTNCDPRTSDMGLHQQIVNGVCTNGAAWAFASNDTCALPGAALVITEPEISASYYMTWYSRPEAESCGTEPIYNRTLKYACGQWCQIDPDETCVNQNPGGLATISTNVPPDDISGATNGTIWSSCVDAGGGLYYIDVFTITGITNEPCGAEGACLTRSSNPIGYVVPTTNYACSRVEYLAAGLPSYAEFSSYTCAPTQYQSETISAALSNGAWVVAYSNTGNGRAWCNTDYVTTGQPYAATCATNAGWAVTNAGARLVWDFRYK